MNNREYRPTIAQLRAFVTIAEHRHFSTSAARLGISQPSLSQALVALESGLNLQLLNAQHGKSLSPRLGKLSFLTHAQPWILPMISSPMLEASAIPPPGRSRSELSPPSRRISFRTFFSSSTSRCQKFSRISSKNKLTI